MSNDIDFPCYEVKWFSEEKGFGFLFGLEEGDEDIFFHRSAARLVERSKAGDLSLVEPSSRDEAGRVFGYLSRHVTKHDTTEVRAKVEMMQQGLQATLWALDVDCRNASLGKT